MPFRPLPQFRQNPGVIFPLTAAIARIYGIRGSDGAYPLGAFYTENVDRRIWRHVGGIWYQPLSPTRIESRRISEVRIERFMRGIEHGANTQLVNGTVVSWEQIPANEAAELPRAR